jgi:hypothetical protein
MERVEVENYAHEIDSFADEDCAQSGRNRVTRYFSQGLYPISTA